MSWMVAFDNNVYHNAMVLPFEVTMVACGGISTADKQEHNVNDVHMYAHLCDYLRPKVLDLIKIIIVLMLAVSN